VLPQTDDLSRKYITWDDIDGLIDHLLPQFRGEFDGLLIITRGGLVAGTVGLGTGGCYQVSGRLCNGG